MSEQQNKPQPAEIGVIPYIAVKDAESAIDFYIRAFGAEVDFKITDPSGKIGHAELKIGSGRLMLADEYPDFGSLSPVSMGGSPVKLYVAVDDVDAATRKATDAGGTLQRAPEDGFHGYRQSMIADPFGYSWFLSCQVEEVSPEVMQQRFDAMFS